MSLSHSQTPFLAPLRWTSRSRGAHQVEDSNAVAASQASVSAGKLLSFGLLAGICACGGKASDSEAPVPDRLASFDTGDGEGETNDSGDYDAEATDSSDDDAEATDSGDDEGGAPDTEASVPDRPEIHDIGDQTAVGSLTVDGETFRTFSGVAYEDRDGALKVVIVSHPHAACSNGPTHLDWLMMDAPRGEYPGINIEIPEYAELSDAYVWEYWRDSTGKGGQNLAWVQLDGANIDQEAEHEIRGRLISADHPQASFDINFAVPFCGTDKRF